MQLHSELHPGELGVLSEPCFKPPGKSHILAAGCRRCATGLQNLGLGALLPSITDAIDESRIGWLGRDRDQDRFDGFNKYHGLGGTPTDVKAGSFYRRRTIVSGPHEVPPCCSALRARTSGASQSSRLSHPPFFSSSFGSMAGYTQRHPKTLRKDISVQ